MQCAILNINCLYPEVLRVFLNVLPIRCKITIKYHDINYGPELFIPPRVAGSARVYPSPHKAKGGQTPSTGHQVTSTLHSDTKTNTLTHKFNTHNSFLQDHSHPLHLFVTVPLRLIRVNELSSDWPSCIVLNRWTLTSRSVDFCVDHTSRGFLDCTDWEENRPL